MNSQASPALTARSIRSSSSIRSSLSSGTTSSGSTDLSSVTQHNNNVGYYTRMQGNIQTPNKQQQRTTDRRRRTKDTNYTDVEINSFPRGNLQMRDYSNTEYWRKSWHFWILCMSFCMVLSIGWLKSIPYRMGIYRKVSAQTLILKIQNLYIQTVSHVVWHGFYWENFQFYKRNEH